MGKFKYDYYMKERLKKFVDKYQDQFRDKSYNWSEFLDNPDHLDEIYVKGNGFIWYLFKLFKKINVRNSDDRFLEDLDGDDLEDIFNNLGALNFFNDQVEFPIEGIYYDNNDNKFYEQRDGLVDDEENSAIDKDNFIQYYLQDFMCDINSIGDILYVIGYYKLTFDYIYNLFEINEG